jgi:hypothetical protein
LCVHAKKLFAGVVAVDAACSPIRRFEALLDKIEGVAITAPIIERERRQRPG